MFLYVIFQGVDTSKGENTLAVEACVNFFVWMAEFYKIKESFTFVYCIRQ
jgi:hypothetical protein